jgi:hypothetical protein
MFRCTIKQDIDHGKTRRQAEEAKMEVPDKTNPAGGQGQSSKAKICEVFFLLSLFIY